MHTTILSSGAIQAFAATRNTVLVVEQGTLWLTQTHDAQDHVLKAGQSLPLKSGRVVLEAEPGCCARYRLEPPQRPTLWRYPAPWVLATR